ncbi:MAG: PAS domain S-box protein, partial [Candidatus Nanopelagicales bacterium]
MGMRAQSTTVDVSRAQIAGRFRNASVLAAAAASLIGLVVLVGGWWLDVAILRQPFADFSAMRAGTAFGLLACGIGVVAAGRAWPAWSMAVAGGVTGALGVSILGGYLAGQSKTKFEALFAVRLNMDEAIPGRIAVNTAVCFVLLGAGLLMLAAREADGLRQSLGMMVVLVAYAAIMGYLMSALAVAGQLTPDYTAMAPHTAVPMFLLGSGITLVSLQRGWGRIFAEPRAGGRALRLGVPVTLTVLLITGGLLTAIANVSGSDISAVEVLLVGLAALVILGMAVIASRIERMSSTIANYASDLDGQVAARMLDLRQATALLQSQFRESPNGIALLDVRGRLLDVNRALCDIVGYSKADLLALGMREISIPERHTHWMQRTQQAITQDGDGTDLVTRLLHRDGTEVWVHESIGVVHDDAGDPELLVCNFVNVSDTVKAQRALAEQEQLLRLILNNSAELIMRYDLDLRVVYVNQRVVEVTGVDYPEWIGKSFHTLGYPTEVADEWEANLRAVLESGSTLTFEYEIDNANGHRWYESTIAAERAESGSVTHAVSTSHDVTSRKLLELQLTELATRDELTGLANRAAMLGELTRALSAGGRSGRPTAVLMIDLDRFKNVNDSL